MKTLAPMTGRDRRGFTLVELMIVVAILAVLAAIAVVGYSKFIKDARDSEAKAFLASVAAKQEQYRSRFGTFVSAPANPATIPSPAQKVPWTQNLPGWLALGSKPKNNFASWQYEVRGGPANQACQPPGDVPTACNAEMANRAWWWAVARHTERVIIINSEREAPWHIDR